jgi:hypothetical protein
MATPGFRGMGRGDPLIALVIARAVAAVFAFAADSAVVVKRAIADGEGRAKNVGDAAAKPIGTVAPGNSVAADDQVVVDGAVADCGRGLVCISGEWGVVVFSSDGKVIDVR